VTGDCGEVEIREYSRILGRRACILDFLESDDDNSKAGIYESVSSAERVVTPAETTGWKFGSV
jgi:hypothetical protein